MEKLDEIIKIQGEEIDLLRNENDRLRNQSLQTPRDAEEEISQLRKHNELLVKKIYIFIRSKRSIICRSITTSNKCASKAI